MELAGGLTIGVSCIASVTGDATVVSLATTVGVVHNQRLITIFHDEEEVEIIEGSTCLRERLVQRLDDDGDAEVITLTRAKA